MLEANLDDLSPQVLAYAMERLAGRRRAGCVQRPVQMKKNRPGALLTVLAKPEDADRLTKLDICRDHDARRAPARRAAADALERRWETVDTTWGPVRIKIANMNGTVSNYAPEYEDCRRIAAEHHVPLKTVMQEAMRVYRCRISERKQWLVASSQFSVHQSSSLNKLEYIYENLQLRSSGGFMEAISSLHMLLDRIPERLMKLSADALDKKPTPTNWSAKEELGHLLDSAANNHQRIVRAQLEDTPAMPGYQQNDWVKVHGYQRREWMELIELWKALNRQLLQPRKPYPAQAGRGR